MHAKSQSASGGRGALSGVVWVGLALSCLLFCARGLLAETQKSPKAAGRALSNAGAWAAPGESHPDGRGPRVPAFRRVEPTVEKTDAASGGLPAFPAGLQPEQLVAPGGLSSTINLMAVLTVLSLAPSILIMTTCFVRFIIVMSLLRQALGTQQLPPNQVLITLCLFLTFMVMAPVWQQSYDQGIKPYTAPEPDQPPPTLAQTLDNTARPIREFMINQIKAAGNTDTVWMFLEYQYPETASGEGRSRALPTEWDEVSLPTLLSAYMLSELKVAFVIGFQIFLPFLVIDMVVSTVLMSMGMMMLTPTLVSFPFKLLLFVLIDGWARIVGMLLASVQG
ncbi:MAG: flagellar type III secretion system pore protein FliP [Deltaproteobacteria bacterium]